MMGERESGERADTAEYFGRLAKTYGSGGYYRKRKTAVAAALGEEIQNAATLLDLGCSNGGYLRAFQEAFGGRLLAGADLSLKMLHEALGRHPGAKAPALVCCDAGALPFRSASFALVFCSHVLQLVADADRGIAEVARCLKPGGLLVVAGGAGGVRRLLRRVLDEHEWSLFENELPRPSSAGPPLDPRAYRGACESAGLDIETRTVAFAVSWADVAEWYHVRWLPLAKGASRATMEKILAQVVAERGPAEIEVAEILLLARKRA